MITAALLAQALPPAVYSLAGTYGTPGDRWDNGELACRVSRDTADREGVAHRSLPCGTRLVICARRCGRAVVTDRGPYGATDGHRYRVQTRGPLPGWHYRGDLDLRQGVARSIGYRGGRVLWSVIR